MPKNAESQWSVQQATPILLVFYKAPTWIDHGNSKKSNITNEIRNWNSNVMETALEYDGEKKRKGGSKKCLHIV